MRTFAIYSLCFLLLGMLACAGAMPQPEVRDTAAPTRIAVVVEQDSVLARGLRAEVAGELRQKLIETRSGVPVEGGDNADLVLRVTIRETNFTHVVRWEWQLVDQTGAMVLSRNEHDRSFSGATAERVAASILVAMGGIDTAAYAQGSVPAKAATAQVAPTAPRPSPTVVFPASETDGNNAFAVIIGVENYRESLPAASGAEADARAFFEFARTTLNVPETNIRLLLGDRASKADISATLMEWLPRNAVEPGGRVYVFFSGHGAPDLEEGSSFLIPFDGNPTFLRSTALAVSELHAQLNRLQEQQVFVFLDSCFSGQGERSVLAEGTRPLVPVQEIPHSPGVVTFTASGARETTGAHRESGHGLFSYYLLQGLGGAADRNGDGHVTLAELESFVLERVRLEARRQNRDQTPRLMLPEAVPAEAVLIEGLERF